MNWSELLPILGQKMLETLQMTLISSFFAYLIGLPLGILLVVTRKNGIHPMPTFNAILGVIINFLRSIPFIILLALLFPVTRKVVGEAIGTPDSVIFPLIISAFPYVARMVEGSMLELDHGVIEAAQSMGSTNWQIVSKVMLPEAVPSLLNGSVISVTTILGYTAMAYSVWNGGLGSMAIVDGLNVQNYDYMYSASLLLVALVQIITVFGSGLNHRLDHKKH